MRWRSPCSGATRCLHRDPPDRRRLVVISYTLMAAGAGDRVRQVRHGLMPLVLADALVPGVATSWSGSCRWSENSATPCKPELHLASEVQRSLMPKSTRRSGPRLRGSFHPLRGRSVVNLFQYSSIGKDDRCIRRFRLRRIGEGLQVAMSATFTVGALASEVSASSSPAAILTRLNTVLYRHSRRGHFVAFLLFVWMSGGSGRCSPTRARRSRCCCARDRCGGSMWSGCTSRSDAARHVVRRVRGHAPAWRRGASADGRIHRRDEPTAGNVRAERLEAALRDPWIGAMTAQGPGPTCGARSRDSRGKPRSTTT